MMTLSPTAVNTFVTCPRQYYEKYITKSVKFKESDAAKYGTLVHSSIENFLVNGEPLPTVLQNMHPVLERMKQVLIGAETELAVDNVGNAVKYRSKAAYLRCKVDAIIADKNRNNVICIDWKTGKKRDAQIQHDFIKKCTAAAYPKAKVQTLFVYLFAGEVDLQSYNKEQPLYVMERAISDLNTAYASNSFPPKKSGLCGKWCDVLSCPNNGKFQG